MRRDSSPHWIRHTPYFDPAEYECSECGARSDRQTRTCPNCGTALSWVDDRMEWVDELNELDEILGGG